MTPKATIMARLRSKRKKAALCYMCGEEPATKDMSSCAGCREVIRIKQSWRQLELPLPEEKFELTEGPATDWVEVRRSGGGNDEA